MLRASRNGVNEFGACVVDARSRDGRGSWRGYVASEYSHYPCRRRIARCRHRDTKNPCPNSLCALERTFYTEAAGLVSLASRTGAFGRGGLASTALVRRQCSPRRHRCPRREGNGETMTGSTMPPRSAVRARRPLTPESLVERADVTPRTPEAETVLRIFRRRQREHAALYVAEMKDLAS